ncbi:cation diffusion facilitator family transporter [Candidatus Saccharibacteria bacterium]|nr:cation diffusion facilitator family transporter [Candidatus Saccharibacteria bacterium]
MERYGGRLGFERALTLMAKTLSDTRVVGTSLLVSISDVVLNLLVAAATGSTVLISQALQGLSDLLTGGLLLLGVKRSKRAADRAHQFGYGREVFFWVLMAGVLMFLGTGGLSVYFGVRQFIDPAPIYNVALAFIMLTLGLVSNFYSFSLSVRRLHQTNTHSGWWWQLRHSSIVETKATLLIDFLGTVAALLGLLAMTCYLATGDSRLDGLGSIAIGLVMMVASFYLIRDVRDLIVGRSVDPMLAGRIIGTVESVSGVHSVLDLRTMYLGSGKLLIILEVHIHDGLSTDQIEKIMDDVKRQVRDEIPEAHHIQVEVETPDSELYK